jgi:histidinol phosphatase-like enzyme
MKPRWTISVDLDGVLANPTQPENYATATAIHDNIDKVNRLYASGWRVVIYTGRGWYQYDMTTEWLRKKGVKYHELVMGKLVAHIYVDDLNGTLDGALAKEINT